MDALYQYSENTPLYKTNEGYLYSKDVLNALKASGIQTGDILFIHSDIASFGKLASFDTKVFLGSLISIFQKAVGKNGTVIMPTFSYSFCKNELFDLEQTKSTVGTLTDFFRNQKDVVRTAHPIFSVAIWGNKKETFIDVSTDSFGVQSIFDKLYQENTKIVVLGSPFYSSCTFIHYIEQMYGVPYRYLKTFNGIIKDKEKEYEAKATYYVRYLDSNVDLDTTLLEQALLDSRVMSKVKLGASCIMTVAAKDFYDIGMHLLKKNIYSFLKEVPTVKS